ncbi:MAG: gamma-glutamyltransferase [Thermoanaerobaculia bacterium]|nr:gamma-glutamyltransferase [Thermoanaerobaculia bacterium]
MRRLIALLVIPLLLPAATPLRASPAVDLSPASWPPGELELYTRLNQELGGVKPEASGREGMIVGTTGSLAVRAGLAALEQGGSAVDAALATAFAQITLAAGSWVSFAGILSLVHYDADTRKLDYLNGEFNTVLGEDDPLSIPSAAPSGRTALVPGFMAAAEAAHQRHGRLPWAELFVPAIYFAEEGFPLDADLAATISFRWGVLSRLPETRAIFTRPDGAPYQTGDLFRQPSLAQTLRRAARNGADEMYTGAWGEKLVAAIQADGGKMTMDDLAAYRPIWKRPGKARFDDYKIQAPRSPGMGGRIAARVFRNLRGVNLATLGHYTESADALFALLSATRDAYGLVPPLHSDGVIAVDDEGNVVALLHSINTSAWGLTGIFVDGVSIPDAAAQQQRRVAAAGPGQRIWTGTNPMIVTQKKRPVLASSAIGRGLMEATVQSLVNILAYGMSPKQAVDTALFRAPRRLPEGGIGPSLVTIGDFPSDVLDEVRARGIEIDELSRRDFESLGYWIGVAMDPETGELLGATTPPLNGRALGR